MESCLSYLTCIYLMANDNGQCNRLSETIGSLAFRLALYLTGVHFRGELHHGGHVGEQKIKCQPIRT